MGMQPESRFKLRVLRDLRRLEREDHGLYVLKTQERARRGILDLILCVKGKYVSIELKIDGERPTKLQQYNIDKIRAAGGVAFFTTPFGWPEHLKILKGMLE